MKNTTIQSKISPVFLAFISVLALTLSLLLTPTSANAATNHSQKNKKTYSFTQLDVNHDHKLSKREVKGSLKTNFAKIDRNKDGYISKAEFNKTSKSKR